MLSVICKRCVTSGVLLCRQINYEVIRTISVSQNLCFGYKRGYGGTWRYKQGMALNKSKYGPLTDLPDYTFLDGRPTPLTRNQCRRKEENVQVATKIMNLLKEVDFAKENHEKRLEERENKKDEKIKLKPKVIQDEMRTFKRKVHKRK